MRNLLLGVFMVTVFVTVIVGSLYVSYSNFKECRAFGHSFTYCATVHK